MPNEQWSLPSRDEAIKALTAHLNGDIKRGSEFALRQAALAAGEGLGGKLTIIFPTNSEKARTRKGMERPCDVSFSGPDLYTWDTGELT